MKTFSSDEVLNRLKEALSVGTDTELADLLGIKKATLSNWRNRNSVDFLLVFSFCEHINIDWLITGRGNPSLSIPIVSLSKEKEVKNENPYIDRMMAQAEEIGRLKERIAQLEREKNASGVTYQSAPPRRETVDSL